MIIVKKIKREILIFSAIFLFVSLGTNFQSFIIDVKADVNDIIVPIDKLNFGIVFPGEKSAKEFTVSLAGADWANYQVAENPASGYLDLCPYLLEEAGEGEGDTKDSAILDKSASDILDAWLLNLDAAGASAGEYGCDLVIGPAIIDGNGNGGGVTYASFGGSSGGGGSNFPNIQLTDNGDVAGEKDEGMVLGEVIVVPETKLSASLGSLLKWFLKSGINNIWQILFWTIILYLPTSFFYRKRRSGQN